MKIVHLGFNHRYNDIRIFEKECVSLAKCGYEVVYIISSNNSPKLGRIKQKGVKIIVIPVISASFYVRLLKYLLDARKEAIRQNADIYHIHEVWFLPMIPVLLKKGKVIYDSHEDAPRAHFERQRGKKTIGVKIEERLFEMYENKKVSQVSGVITATPHIAKRFRKIQKNVITVANYPIIDTSPIQAEKMGTNGKEYMGRTGAARILQANGAKKPMICYVGGISKERGIEQLIQAMEHIDAHLMIAGKTDIKYKNRLMQIKGAEKCTFLGYLERADIDRLYDQCVIGFCTLWNQPNAYYSWPIKMFEYMAAGLPVIASDFPEWKKIIEKHKCGVCVDPENSAQIAAAVNRLLADEKLARIMGENGRKMVEKKYNWANEKKKLISFYRCV